MAVELILLKNIIEAAMLVEGKPLNMKRLMALFEGKDEIPERSEIKHALEILSAEYQGRGVELIEVASGYRIQARQEMEPWIARLFEEKPPRYSRALLETLVLIAYRQPITRSEIEAVRGVAVSTHIIKTLLEREWVRVVGHKEVPGRPAMYATTSAFLDYFNIKGIDELPTLSEIKDLDKLGQVVEKELAEDNAEVLADVIDDDTQTEEARVLEVNDSQEVDDQGGEGEQSNTVSGGIDFKKLAESMEPESTKPESIKSRQDLDDSSQVPANESIH